MQSEDLNPQAALATAKASGAVRPPDPEPTALLAHISMRGDVIAHTGAWLGAVGSGLAIEGIMCAPGTGGAPEVSPVLEYQCVYPHDLKSPWIPAGQPCGSAGLSLGIVGLRFRLRLDTAPFFRCSYDVTFVDGSRLEDVASPQIALSPTGAAVEAVRLRVEARPPLPLLVLSDLDQRPPPPGGESPAEDPLIRLRLLSPAFSTRLPTLQNPEQLAPKARAAMEPSWERRVFAPRAISLRVLDKAFVAQEGIVLDREGSHVPGTTRLFSEAAIAEGRAQVAALRDSPDIRRIPGTSVLCKSRAAPNFGHYLVEMLPKAWLAQRLMPHHGLTFIVHDSPILDRVIDSLVRLGIPAESIAATDDAPVLCDRLFIFDGLTSHGAYQSPLCARALTEMAEDLPAAPYAKLFVRRDRPNRPMLNEDAVVAILRERGFITVDPGKMSLTEQIVLFKGAAVVVGALGAAMTNIAFCAPGAKVVALTSASFPDTFFWFLSQHRHHSYIEVRGQDTPEAAAETKPWRAGFTIDEPGLAYLQTL